MLLLKLSKSTSVFTPTRYHPLKQCFQSFKLIQTQQFQFGGVSAQIHSDAYPDYKQFDQHKSYFEQINSKFEIQQVKPKSRESKRTGVLAVKQGMTTIWDHWGKAYGCTVLQVDRCQVLRSFKNQSGTYSLELGIGEKKLHRVNRVSAGQFIKAGVYPKKFVKSFEVTEEGLLPSGYMLGPSHFDVYQFVDVKSTSKGKGTQGVMKRWNFSGQNATHGNSKAHRAPGSIGHCEFPGKVWKGKKMAGQMGNKSSTVLNQRVIKVDNLRGLLYIQGNVPGAIGALVKVRDAAKKIDKQVYKLKFPTSIGEIPDEHISLDELASSLKKELQRATILGLEEPVSQQQKDLILAIGKGLLERVFTNSDVAEIHTYLDQYLSTIRPYFEQEVESGNLTNGHANSFTDSLLKSVLAQIHFSISFIDLCRKEKDLNYFHKTSAKLQFLFQYLDYISELLTQGMSYLPALTAKQFRFRLQESFLKLEDSLLSLDLNEEEEVASMIAESKGFYRLFMDLDGSSKQSSNFEDSIQEERKECSSTNNSNTQKVLIEESSSQSSGSEAIEEDPNENIDSNSPEQIRLSEIEDSLREKMQQFNQHKSIRTQQGWMDDEKVKIYLEGLLQFLTSDYETVNDRLSNELNEQILNGFFMLHLCYMSKQCPPQMNKTNHDLLAKFLLELIDHLNVKTHLKSKQSQFESLFICQYLYLSHPELTQQYLTRQIEGQDHYDLIKKQFNDPRQSLKSILIKIENLIIKVLLPEGKHSGSGKVKQINKSQKVQVTNEMVYQQILKIIKLADEGFDLSDKVIEILVQGRSLFNDQQVIQLVEEIHTNQDFYQPMSNQNKSLVQKIQNDYSKKLEDKVNSQNQQKLKNLKAQTQPLEVKDQLPVMQAIKKRGRFSSREEDNDDNQEQVHPLPKPIKKRTKQTDVLTSSSDEALFRNEISGVSSDNASYTAFPNPAEGYEEVKKEKKSDVFYHLKNKIEIELEYMRYGQIIDLLEEGQENGAFYKKAFKQYLIQQIELVAQEIKKVPLAGFPKLRKLIELYKIKIIHQQGLSQKLVNTLGQIKEIRDNKDWQNLFNDLLKSISTQSQPAKPQAKQMKPLRGKGEGGEEGAGEEEESWDCSIKKLRKAVMHKRIEQDDFERATRIYKYFVKETRQIREHFADGRDFIDLIYKIAKIALSSNDLESSIGGKQAQVDLRELCYYLKSAISSQKATTLFHSIKQFLKQNDLQDPKWAEIMSNLEKKKAPSAPAKGKQGQEVSEKMLQQVRGKYASLLDKNIKFSKWLLNMDFVNDNIAKVNKQQVFKGGSWKSKMKFLLSNAFNNIEKGLKIEYEDVQYIRKFMQLFEEQEINESLLKALAYFSRTIIFVNDQTRDEYESFKSKYNLPQKYKTRIQERNTHSSSGKETQEEVKVFHFHQIEDPVYLKLIDQQVCDRLEKTTQDEYLGKFETMTSRIDKLKQMKEDLIILSNKKNVLLQQKFFPQGDQDMLNLFEKHFIQILKEYKEKRYVTPDIVKEIVELERYLTKKNKKIALRVYPEIKDLFDELPKVNYQKQVTQFVQRSGFKFVNEYFIEVFKRVTDSIPNRSQEELDNFIHEKHFAQQNNFNYLKKDIEMVTQALKNAFESCKENLEIEISGSAAYELTQSETIDELTVDYVIHGDKIKLRKLVKQLRKYGFEEHSSGDIQDDINQMIMDMDDNNLYIDLIFQDLIKVRLYFGTDTAIYMNTTLIKFMKCSPILRELYCYIKTTQMREYFSTIEIMCLLVHFLQTCDQQKQNNLQQILPRFDQLGQQFEYLENNENVSMWYCEFMLFMLRTKPKKTLAIEKNRFIERDTLNDFTSNTFMILLKGQPVSPTLVRIPEVAKEFIDWIEEHLSQLY